MSRRLVEGQDPGTNGSPPGAAASAPTGCHFLAMDRRGFFRSSAALAGWVGLPFSLIFRQDTAADGAALEASLAAGTSPPQGSMTSAPVDPEWIDVRRFGAVGDGRHDDTNAIRRAIAAGGAASRSSPDPYHSPSDLRLAHLPERGAVVYLPPGRYLLRSSLAIPPFTCLRGAGAAQTILVLVPGSFRNADRPQPMIAILPASVHVPTPPRRPGGSIASMDVPGWDLLGFVGVPGVRISDFSLFAEAERNPGAGGILWAAGPGCWAEGINVQTASYGLWLRGGSGPLCIRDSTVEGCSPGIAIHGAGTTCIIRVRVASPGFGAQVDHSGPISFDDFTFAGMGAALSLTESTASAQNLHAAGLSPISLSAVRSSQSEVALESVQTTGYGFIILDDDPVGVRLAARTMHETYLAAYAGQHSILLDPVAVASSDSSGRVLPAETPIRVNCGGPARSEWKADAGWTGGKAAATDVSFTLVGAPLAAPVEVYGTYREGGCEYVIACPRGPALLRLHFAPSDETATVQRIFGIAVNGKPRRINFDLSVESGPRHVLVLDFPMEETSGIVGLKLTQGSQGLPLICGIEIIPLGAALDRAHHVESAVPGNTPGIALPAVPTAISPIHPVPVPDRAAGNTNPSLLNLRMAGAVGDGIADDWSVIQQAASAPGANLYLPGGTYRLTRPLRLAAGASLTGLESTRARLSFDLPASTTSTAPTLVIAEPGESVLLQNVEIISPSPPIALASPQTPAPVGFRAQNVDRVVLRHVRLHNSGIGVALVQCNDNTLADVEVAGRGTGVLLDRCPASRLEACWFEGNTDAAVRVSDGIATLVATSSWSDAPLLGVEGTGAAMVRGCAAIARFTGAPAALRRDPSASLFCAAFRATGFHAMAESAGLTLAAGSPSGSSSMSLYADGIFARDRYILSQGGDRPGVTPSGPGISAPVVDTAHPPGPPASATNETIDPTSVLLSSRRAIVYGLNTMGTAVGRWNIGGPDAYSWLRDPATAPLSGGNNALRPALGWTEGEESRFVDIDSNSEVGVADRATEPVFRSTASLPGPQLVYATRRTVPHILGYQFLIAPAAYIVRLHLVAYPGDRTDAQCNINIDGVTRWAGLRVAEEAGGVLRALVPQWRVVCDGTLLVQLESVIGPVSLAGIEVYEVD